jgi:hypothetical protein
MTRLTPNDPIFDEPLLERCSVGMPPNYFPDIPGVLFAGRKMLDYAGCVSRARCPYGWKKRELGVYVRHLRYDEQFDTSRVQQSGGWWSNGWQVERFDSCSPNDFQVLVFGLEYVPIWGHSRREAMFLAEYYRHDQALQLVGCCWKSPYTH